MVAGVFNGREAIVYHYSVAASDDDPIDQLIAELHASDESPGAAAGDTARLERWLRALVGAGGSDLLLVPGASPSIRVDGRVRGLADGPIDGVGVEEAVLPALRASSLPPEPDRGWIVSRCRPRPLSHQSAP
jgi:hypothetical protein